MSEETATYDSGAAPATEAAPAPTTEAAPATESAQQSTPDIFSSQPQATPSGDLMSQLYTSEGDLAENYTSLLEENGLGELTNTVAKYKSPEGLLKGAANLISFAGKKVEGVIVPNEGSTEQEIAEYRQAIGVPESSTAYQIELPDTMNENMGWNNGLGEAWQDAFHEMGLSNEQAQKMTETYTDITNQQFEQAMQAQELKVESEMEAQRKEVQKQWGDKYDSNLQNVVNMAETMGFDLDNEHDMAAMRNPKVLNMILAKHDSLKEGSMPKGGQPNTGTDSFHNQAMAMKAKYPNMNTAPIEFQRKYIELQKMNHLQMSQRGQ